MKSGSSYRARWGLLVVTVVMGAALVITGVAGYLGARRASDAFAKAAATAMVVAVRHDLFHSAGDPQGAVELAVTEMGEQGLKFAGVIDRKGKLVQSAGTPLADISRTAWRRAPEPIHVESLVRPGTVRVLARIGTCKGCGMRRWNTRRPSRRKHTLVIDVEPRIVGLIMSRALITLAITLAAAVILAIAAIIFWRLSRRADAIEAQLVRDQRLKSLGQMSAVLGHELRNPLASLKGHAQLMLERLSDDHPSRRGAETVVEEARRLELLSSQVLDFARTGELELRRIDPLALVRGALERADVEPVNLDAGNAPTSWMVDPDRMEQVLINLLVNARQASAEGAEIEVRVNERGGELLIEIRDQGEGVDPDDLERIFEPFYTTRVRGTGLGLAVAQRIVEEHEGRIAAVSRAGGTVFQIALPRRNEEG